MRRIFAYIISSLFITATGLLKAQDTIVFPLKIKAGLEISGPAIYISDKKNLSAEGYVSYDLNQRTAMVLAGGFLNYEYSQYNYECIHALSPRICRSTCLGGISPVLLDDQL